MANKELGFLNHRHMAILELLLVQPELTTAELASRLNYSPSRVSAIINSKLFQLALAERRRQTSKTLLELATEATAAALRFHVEILQDEKAPVSIKLESARDVLAQGHVKAVEKSAKLDLTASIPKELFAQLAGVTKELAQPFIPAKRLKSPEECGEEEREEAVS